MFFLASAWGRLPNWNSPISTPAPSSFMCALIARVNRVGIADERHPLLLREVEPQLVERQLLGQPHRGHEPVGLGVVLVHADRVEGQQVEGVKN